MFYTFITWEEVEVAAQTDQNGVNLDAS